MEGSCEEPVAVDVNVCGETPRRDGTGIRRRMVQSTLFPAKPLDNGKVEAEHCVQDEIKSHLTGEEEEDFGSRRKRRNSSQKKNTKATRQSRAPDKVLSNDEMALEKMVDLDSPVVNNVESPGKLNKSAKSRPTKRRINSTPKKMENSCLFAAKQVHPFFSSCKMGKKYLEFAHPERKLCSNGKNEFNPIHVFEKDQEDASSFDWSKWTFFDCMFGRTDSEQQPFWSVEVDYKASADSLKFDDFLSASHQMDKGKEVVGLQQSWGDDRPNEFPNERMMSYYHRYTTEPKNCLWTTKYKPKSSSEVCGNGECVNFINEWLKCWQERGYQSCKSSSLNDKWSVQDDCYGWESCSDYENVDEDNCLKNVLLITGPVGSGKSAAIYACAKEQGFQVIEVNASDWRNGTLVKQKFGEAVESQWLQRTGENLENLETKTRLRSLPAVVKTLISHINDGESIDLLHSSDEEESKNASIASEKSVWKHNRTSIAQPETKTLILFEDVDATLDSDHGFIASIQQLAQKAKRPMILTSNSTNPALPNNLDREELCFKRPTHKELLHLLNMVCDTEKYTPQPDMLEKFIECCHGDIRKTIMNFQFWFQGQSVKNDNPAQSAYYPLLFDVVAAHKILPKLIPWGYPSQLSLLVEEEIAKSLLLIEEKFHLKEVSDKEDLIVKTQRTSQETYYGEMEGIDAIKEPMLSGHCSTENDDESGVHLDVACESSHSSGPPVAFTRRSVWKKPSTVFSSDSEQHCSNGEIPLTCDTQLEDTTPEMVAEVNSQSTEQLTSLGDEMPLNICTHLETAGFWHFDDICKSFDVSCVPESSVVAETQSKDENTMLSTTKSSGLVKGRSKPTCATGDFISDLTIFKNRDLVHLHKKIGVEHSSNINLESVNEEMGDSHLECVEAVEICYEVMDQCSQMDFSRNFMQENRISVADSVQEAWRKFHTSHMELGQYVTSERSDASRVLNLSHGFGDLISVADLLLSRCQALIYEVAAEPSAIRLDNSDLVSWYDHLQMTSEIAQHGVCFYAKQIGEKHASSTTKVDLVWEMLASCANTTALGKLLTQNVKKFRGLENDFRKSNIPPKSIFKSSLRNIVHSVVPLKSQLTLNGDAFHDYLSSMGQISKLEAFRLLDRIKTTKRRRTYIPKHYLSSGLLMLSPEDISILSQYCYGKCPSQFEDTIQD